MYKTIIAFSLFIVLIISGSFFLERTEKVAPLPVVSVPQMEDSKPEVIEVKETPKKTETPKVTVPKVVTQEVITPTVETPVIETPIVEEVIVPEEEIEEPVTPVQKETVYTLTLPIGSPVEEPKSKMTLSELQFFTANLFSVYDSPYSHFLNASADEIISFLEQNGYEVLIQKI